MRETFLKLNHEFSNEAPPGRGEFQAETFVFGEIVLVVRNFSADMHSRRLSSRYGETSRGKGTRTGCLFAR